jgi:pyridoxal biosynthesis lyase PdxS
VISDMSYYIIQLVFGAGLVLGSRGLTELLRRLRYGDAAQSPAVESAE